MGSGGGERPGSTGSGRLAAALVATGLIGALALLVAEFSTLFSVSVGGHIVRRVAGHSQHAFALALLGLAASAMVLFAARGARPARLAIAALGVLGLVIAIVGDLPDVHATGLFGASYENATAKPGAAFYEETLGAALLLVCGGGLLSLGAGGVAPWQAESEDASYQR